MGLSLEVAGPSKPGGLFGFGEMAAPEVAEGLDVGVGVAFEGAGDGAGLRGAGGELAEEAGGDKGVIHGAEFALEEAEAVEAGFGLFEGEDF